MTRVCSGLVAAGLILGVGAAGGQAPPGKAPKPAPTELESALAAANNHPDVRMAQAKLQVAQAELDQARLLVNQRITAAHAKLQSAKAQAEFESQNHKRILQLTAWGGLVAQGEVQAAERSLAQAKAALAAAEAEWQAARGQPSARQTLRDAALDPRALSEALSAEAYLAVMAQQYLTVKRPDAPPAPGSAADRLRGLIDKRVPMNVPAPVPLDQAMAELMKQADVLIRYPEWASALELKDPPKVGPLRGEQTVAAWFQLILDDFNRSLSTATLPPDFPKGRHEVYVRDYGLLITKTDLAPPGAPTLAEFARQVRAEKDAPKPEPKK